MINNSATTVQSKEGMDEERCFSLPGRVIQTRGKRVEVGSMNDFRGQELYGVGLQEEDESDEQFAESSSSSDEDELDELDLVQDDSIGVNIAMKLVGMVGSMAGSTVADENANGSGGDDQAMTIEEPNK